MTIRSLIRSPIRSLVSSAFGGGGGLLSQATSQLGGVAPYHYWDFINNRALFAQADVGGVTSTPGWSFARASTGYAETAAGVLVPFASGELRRTDKGVLIEGARTNLCLRSQEFDNASWSKARSSILANAAAAPDGTLTADKLVEDSTAANSHNASQTITLADSTTYVFTVFTKAAERTWAYLQVTTKDGTVRYAYINLATGAEGTTSPGLTWQAPQQLADGWWRWGVSFASATGATTPLCVLGPATGNGGRSYDGDGASGIYLWGAQLE